MKHQSDTGNVLDYSQTTIRTILKDKVRKMEHVKGPALMKTTIITKKRKNHWFNH